MSSRSRHQSAGLPPKHGNQYARRLPHDFANRLEWPAEADFTEHISGASGSFLDLSPPRSRVTDWFRNCDASESVRQVTEDASEAICFVPL
jgi:hypothetical protein